MKLDKDVVERRLNLLRAQGIHFATRPTSGSTSTRAGSVRSSTPCCSPAARRAPATSRSPSGTSRGAISRWSFSPRTPGACSTP
jgi:hypothetical protein